MARPAEIGPAGAIDWLVLLAQDEAGYDNLCRLVSAAHLDRPIQEEPHVAFDALEGATDGLIALTAGGEGALARLFADGQDDKARAYAGRLKALFPDRLYIELSRRGDAVEEAAEAALIELAYALDLPLVATNPAQYAEPEFHAAHDAMLCIAAFDLCREQRAADIVARGLAQAGAGDGGVVRRPSRSDRQHRGHRPALRGRGAEAPADPAAPVSDDEDETLAARGSCRA